MAEATPTSYTSSGCSKSRYSRVMSRIWMSSTMGARMPTPITSPFRGFRVGVGVGTSVGTGEGVGEGRALGAGVSRTGSAARPLGRGLGVTWTTCSLRSGSGSSTAAAWKDRCRKSRAESPAARMRLSASMASSQTISTVVRLCFVCVRFSMAVLLPISSCTIVANTGAFFVNAS